MILKGEEKSIIIPIFTEIIKRAMKTPLVSVIIPNYNHALYLKQRIETVLNQTFKDFEVIILDDASTDNSLEYLKEFKNHPKVSHSIFNTENSGSPFKQWFKGISLAKGEYIWIAESDDFASPLFLSTVMEAFNNSSQPDIVFVGTTNVNEKSKDIGNFTRIEKKYTELLSKNFFIKGKAFLEKFIPNYCIIRNASSAVFKKSLITNKSKEVIGFKVIGDFYFWINFCLENCSFMYISKKLNFMRNHQHTVRRSSGLAQKKEKEFKRIHKEVVFRSNFNVKVFLILIKYYLRKKK